MDKNIVVKLYTYSNFDAIKTVMSNLIFRLLQHNLIQDP
jgi:hypothetical protein